MLLDAYARALVFVRCCDFACTMETPLWISRSNKFRREKICIRHRDRLRIHLFYQISGRETTWRLYIIMFIIRCRRPSPVTELAADSRIIWHFRELYVAPKKSKIGFPGYAGQNRRKNLLATRKTFPTGLGLNGRQDPNTSARFVKEISLSIVAGMDSMPIPT